MKYAAISINFDSLGEAYGFPPGYKDPSFSDVAERFFKIAENYKFKYSIYLIGKDLEKPENRECVKKWASQAHEIGNHSYSHKRLVFKNPYSIWREIKKTDQILRKIGITGNIHFRAPYGAKFILLPIMLAWMKKKNIMWSIDPKDYQESIPGVVEKHIINKIKPGSIILLHELSQTVLALENIIKQLKKMKYKFATISGLMNQ